MTRNRAQLGKQYEQQVQQYLLAQGYTVVAANFRFHRLEIDLIGVKGNELVFFEIKYRRANKHYNPRLAVSRTKQARIKKCAMHFLQKYPEYRQYYSRYDAVFIIDQGGRYQLDHIKQAFSHN